MRRSGGAPVVMCMSLAPFSIMARSSWWRLTCSACSLIGPSASIGHRHAHDLFRRRDAVDDLANAAHAQRAHAVLDRTDLELGGGGALEHHLLQGVREAHDL